jgi:hypothetical protein
LVKSNDHPTLKICENQNMTRYYNMSPLSFFSFRKGWHLKSLKKKKIGEISPKREIKN